jgi:hypothetical protein
MVGHREIMQRLPESGNMTFWRVRHHSGGTPHSDSMVMPLT